MHLWMVIFRVPFWVTVTLTSDLVFRIIVSDQISYIIWARNPKFGVWLHRGMAECHVPSFGSLWHWLISRIIVSGVYLLYYLRLESQINLVYGCIFGWWYVADHLRSLWPIYDLVSRIIGSGVYNLYYLR